MGIADAGDRDCRRQENLESCFRKRMFGPPKKAAHALIAFYLWVILGD